MVRARNLALATILLLGTANSSAQAQSPVEGRGYVVSYIDAAPTANERTAALLRQLQQRSPAITGAMHVEALQRTAPNNQFVLLTTWKDEQTLDSYSSGFLAKELGEMLRTFVIGPIDDRLCIATDVAPSAWPLPAAAIRVVTHVDVPNNFRDRILPALATLARTSRGEPGNLRFDVLHQKSRINHFTMIEVWTDQASDDAHELSAHTRQFRNVLTPITGALYDQRWYKVP